MLEYSIIVRRADGRSHSVPIKDPSFAAICCQVFRFAQNAAIHGCPLGDALPPEWVEIRDAAGATVLRVVVDDSLKPKAL